MAKQNYRQAKKNREAARKVRQQQKLERKQNRAVAAGTTPEPPPSPASGTEDIP
jgi:hypothetical protein